MKKYRFNPDTNLLVEDKNNLGKYFYKTPWREATQLEIDNDEIIKRKKYLIDIRKKYLRQSDWFLLREMDEPGKPTPINIKNQRILVRKEINDIEACTTINELINFSDQI